MDPTRQAELSEAGAAPERVPILLVDDRPSNLLSLRAVLERPDYELVLARSGHEALSAILRQEFAVILLDVAMPGMDGFEIASIIKEREQSRLIPILFITASVYDMDHVFRGYKIGAVDYLRKPFDPHAVRTKVSVFVELYRQRRQIERQSIQLREAAVREQRLLRERAEEELRESEAIYQLTFEHAPVGIGHASTDGRWVRANRALSAMLGYGPDAILGHAVEELGGGDPGHELTAALARLRSGETTSYAGEHRLVVGEGAHAWVYLTIACLRDGTGAITRWIVVAADISARKEMELERAALVEELRHNIRARDDFLSIAAHELKTPITPLRLQAENLLRDLQRSGNRPYPRDKLQRRLEAVERASQRLETLVDKLLDVSRVRLGRLTLDLEEVDLAAVARDVVSRLAAEAERAGSPVTLQADLPVVGRWDRVRMEQVTSNLLSNAIKYGEGKPIAVSVSVEGAVGRLVVSDQGIGIPAESQQRIFERFERIASMQHYSGFGLGLWITRQLVEAHGGTVHVRSRPGQGSEFTVELPRHVDAERQPPAADAEARQ